MKNTAVIPFLFFVLVLSFSDVKAQNFPDGTDLFIEALRYGTANHTIVHSLHYVAEQTYRRPTLTEEQLEEQLNEHITSLRESHERVKRRGVLILPFDEEENRAVLRPQLMGGAVLRRFTVKYKAPSFLRRMMSLQIEQRRPDGTGWEADTQVIESNVTIQRLEAEGVTWFPQGRTASISNMPSNMDGFLNFGRLQGMSVPPMLFLLFQDTDVEKYEFSETNIAKFKAEREKQFQEGQIKLLVTVGTTTYDNGATAFVVESSFNEQVQERYWIDVARGYIVPLIQYYDSEGQLFSEYKARDFFLHERSGLWFPQVYEEITRDKDGLQIFKEYSIDESSLDVNFPIADDEFQIEITEGSTIADDRKGKGSKRYKAQNNGVLSLGKDGLDLEKMDWLYATGVSPFELPSMSLGRILSLAAGVVLILLGLYFYFYRKT